MDEKEFSGRQYDPHGRPIQPSFWQRVKKFLGPVGVGFVIFFKYLVETEISPAQFSKPVAQCYLSIGAYAMFWGWPFAVGFVLLIFVHECGHLIAAKRIGLKVGAPVFIPFMGAIIALKEAPRNAWIEAQVGIGGPLGDGRCGDLRIDLSRDGNRMFRELAYTGFFLNLFNLAPVGFLDGGRIVTALSPWLWLVGFGIMVYPDRHALQFYRAADFNFFSAAALFSVPRKSEDERSYFEVTPAQRWTMAAIISA